MKVHQLIEALQRMPQDAEVLTHADNHTTGLGTNNDIRVAVASYSGYLGPAEVVVVGNWSGWNIGHWAGAVVPRAPVYEVLTWGDDKGELRERAIVHKPAHKEREWSYRDVPESWEFK